MDRFLEFFENHEGNYIFPKNSAIIIQSNSEHLFLRQKSLWYRSKRISRRNGSREGSLKGWYHVERKKRLPKLQLMILCPKLQALLRLVFEEIRRKRYFPLLFPLPPLPSPLFLFPLLYLSFLLQLSVFPLFIIFCSLSQPGRSRLGRWTFWNDLAIASRCFFFLLFFFSPSFFSLLTFTLFSLLFFLNPRNVGHSSWEAKSGENRVPPATRHLYINHVRFEHHEFAQNPFFFFISSAHLWSLVTIYRFQDILNWYYIFSKSFIDRN